MGAVAFDRRAGDKPDSAAQRRLYAVPGVAAEPAAGTLDALLTSAWTAVGTGAVTGCPVCAGTLAPSWMAGSGANGGRCRDCGSTLS